MSKYIISTIVLVILFSCKSKNTEGVESSDEKSSENTTIVSLTSEQIKTLGITIGQLETREMSSTVKANGIVQVLNQHKAAITTLLNGTVQQILIHQGDFVQKGQTVALLANPSFISLQEEFLMVQAQLNAGNNEAIASVANPQFATLQEQYSSLQPQIDLYQKEVKRQKELNIGNAGSGKSLQQAEAELASLTAKSTTLQSQMAVFSKNATATLHTKYNALEKKLKILGVNSNTLSSQKIESLLPIKSPISGKVGEINAKIGAFINENSVICEVIDLSNIHLDLNIYEPDISKFHDGQKVQFTLINNPNQTYQAEVHNIGAMLNPTTKTVEVHAHIEGNKTGLIEGMSVLATVNTGKNKVLVVPNDAIVNHEGKDYIFVQKQADAKETIFNLTLISKGSTEGKFSEITPIQPIASDAKIALNNAFFILGKMTNTGEE